MDEELLTSGGKSKITSLCFYGLHLVSNLVFLIIGIVAMVKAAQDKTYYKMFFSIDLMTQKDLSAEEIDATLILTEQGVSHPFSNLFMAPEKGVMWLIFILMLTIHCGYAVILLVFGFKDAKFFNMSLGKFGRLMSLAVLCECGELLMPIIQEKNDDKGSTKLGRARNIAGLLLSLIALTISLLAYALSDKCKDSIYSFLFRKVFVSSILCFHIFHSLYCLVYLDFYKNSEHIELEDNHWEKKFYVDQSPNSWSMILLHGIVSGIICYFGADVCMGCTAFLFNLGFMIYSTGVPTSSTLDYNYSGIKKLKIGNMVCSILLMLGLGAAMFCAVIFKKTKCLE